MPATELADVTLVEVLEALRSVGAVSGFRIYTREGRAALTNCSGCSIIAPSGFARSLSSANVKETG